MAGTIILLLIHVAMTWFMTGVIWFVQLVHYPLLRFVGRENYERYHRMHMRRTTWVVMPAMLLELLTAILLLTIRPPFISMPLALIGLGLLILIWAATFFLQVPQHNRLEEGFNKRSYQLLVSTNWLRTLLWSFRALLTGFMLYRFLQGDSTF